MIDGGYLLFGIFGQRIPVPGTAIRTPNTTARLEIYTQGIREILGPSNDRHTDDAVDPNGIRKTIAHEAGHSVDINHYTSPDPLNHPVDTVMMSGFDLNNQNNIPTGYNNYDRLQIRLH
jgi:hypothetical protein